ncbi:hypothetical protein MC885_003912 [Smutsia gigantea]|nr:hypothetical protein MC885_003912 [Smutsia gigantea]
MSHTEKPPPSGCSFLCPQPRRVLELSTGPDLGTGRSGQSARSWNPSANEAVSWAGLAGKGLEAWCLAHILDTQSRALADILRQQGPIPIAHCERETISAIDTSPKENTPVRSSSTNHYTPMRTAKQTPGGAEGCEDSLQLCMGTPGQQQVHAEITELVRRPSRASIRKCTTYRVVGSLNPDL